MTLFASIEQAIFFLIIIAISLYLLNRLLSLLLGRIEGIKMSQRNKILFIIRLLSIGGFIYILINEIPIYSTIPPEYSAIITGSISTALAFATSGIFSNYIAGLLIWVIDPFDIGDVVQIKNKKGIIKSITLTKVILETFDRVVFEVSNSELVSSLILNYSIKLKRKKNFIRFKRQIRSPQEKGNARLDIDIFDENLRKEYENELEQIHKDVLDNDAEVIHTFTFKMYLPYDSFRIKVDKIEAICKNYKKLFGIKPRFHVMDFRNNIIVKFRILTLNSNDILNYQAHMAEDIYKIINEK